MLKASASPKFSILMPTYNRGDIISFAIESVLAQTEQDFELLIVGDGCTDNTSTVIKKYLKDKRIKWFDLPKAPGFGYANRNVALKQAKGKYMAFMAHDDIIFPDHLKILSEYLDNDPTLDLVYTRSLWVDSKGTVLPSPYDYLHETTFDIFMNRGNGVAASCFLYRSGLHKKIGYWDESLLGLGDWDLWRRIIRSSKTKNYTFDPRPTCLHFKAIWKKEKQTWPAGLDFVASYLKKHKRRIPEDLTLKIPKGKTEQETYWNKMQKDKKYYIKIRESCIGLLDYFVYHEMSKFLSRFNNNETLEIQRKIDIQKMQYEIQQLKKSKLYRAKEFVKKILPGKS
jgi:glycosyltransferase involved in cell wall biosynthesis